LKNHESVGILNKDVLLSRLFYISPAGERAGVSLKPFHPGKMFRLRGVAFESRG
jgi:hypothetical protein